MASTSGIISVGCTSHCFAQKDTKNSNMNIWHSGSKLTILMLVLQGCWGRFPGVQETPFEIVSISQASVLLLVIIYGQLYNHHEFFNVHYYSGRLRYSNRAVIIVMQKVSYSCFAWKIVTAVPSHRAHLVCNGSLSIVIIGSYVTGYGKISHFVMCEINRTVHFAMLP